MESVNFNSPLGSKTGTFLFYNTMDPASKRVRVQIFHETQKVYHKKFRNIVARSIKDQVVYKDGRLGRLKPPPSRFLADIQVIYGDSFDVARQMMAILPKGLLPCVLNMASDQKPGGGVISGASAQEEELCRRSTLYPALNALSKLYPWPTLGTCVITPGVLVFRASESYDYLANPFHVHVVSQHLCGSRSA